MPSYQIASDLSFEVLQRRARRFELSTPPLDSRNERLVPLPSATVQREAFMASRETIHDADTWHALRVQRRLER